MQNKPKPSVVTNKITIGPKPVTLNPSPSRKQQSASQQSLQTPSISKSDKKPVARNDEVTLQANTSDINSEGRSSGVHSKKNSRERTMTAYEAVSEQFELRNANSAL